MISGLYYSPSFHANSDIQFTHCHAMKIFEFGVGILARPLVHHTIHVVSIFFLQPVSDEVFELEKFSSRQGWVLKNR